MKVNLLAVTMSYFLKGGAKLSIRSLIFVWLLSVVCSDAADCMGPSVDLVAVVSAHSTHDRLRSRSGALESS